MGFFDRKTWQLKRKVKDLQAELREAEKQGRYVVEGGLFFAELAEMGDKTMLVLGSDDKHTSEERGVIIAFYDRNGFEVEALKFGKNNEGIAEIQILPPFEFLKAIVGALKTKEYRVMDDGGRERPSDITVKMITASDLIAAVNALFAMVVEKIIKTTQVKMNKEGNRLLKWMPEIRRAFMNKVGLEVIEDVRPFFEEAYGAFYARAVSGGSGAGRDASSARIDRERRSPAAQRPRTPTPRRPAPEAAKTPPPAAASAPASGAAPPADGVDVLDEILQEAQKTFNEAMKRFSFVFSEKMKKHMGQLPPAPDWESTPRPGADGGYSREDVAKLMRSEQLAKVLAMMYRSLVDASPARCVSNCEALLRNVNRLFNATATCVMKRTGRADDSMTIYAQAGQKLVWGDAGAEGYPVSASIVRNCVLQGSVATSNPMLQDPSASMMAYNIEATAAAPIVVEGETVGILYADRRDDKRPFNQDDCEAMRKVVKVFEEFPRLTLGVN